MRRVAALAAVLALVSGATADAAPTTPLGHSGRWVTDAQGRVVILHGVNMVYKRPPYFPSAAGFDAPDAAFLARHGFNTVRLGLIYAGVEPAPGSYDEAYLDQIASTERLLADHGIFSQLDFHQDLYNERFQGEGWPDWAVLDDGLPAAPQLGFPDNYFAMPGLIRSFDNFWANASGREASGSRTATPPPTAASPSAFATATTRSGTTCSTSRGPAPPGPPASARSAARRSTPALWRRSTTG